MYRALDVPKDPEVFVGVVSQGLRGDKLDNEAREAKKRKFLQPCDISLCNTRGTRCPTHGARSALSLCLKPRIRVASVD